MTTNTEKTKRPILGTFGKGDGQHASIVSYQNTGEAPVKAGQFVGLSTQGIKSLSTTSDKLVGVVVNHTFTPIKKQNEMVDVLSMSGASSIFVEIAPEKTVQRGDKVHVVAVAPHSGKIQAEAEDNKTIESPYTVLSVYGDVAEITLI